jgi:hypothetical protein
MKKLAILISGALFSLAGIAAEPSDTWVISGKDRISCEKVNLGIAKARLTLDNGEKMTMPLNQIDSYAENGMVFHRKLIYKNGKPTGDTKLMQLMKFKDGLSLYKTIIFDEDLGSAVNQYTVYKGEDLYLALDNKSIPSVFNFFNVKWAYK